MTNAIHADTGHSSLEGIALRCTLDIQFCVSNVHLKDIAVRDTPINLRAEPSQRSLIDQAAAILGKNRSDFMLEAACDKARSVLLDQVHFQLSDEAYDRFVALLDAPPRKNPRLQRLMARKPLWEK